MVERENVKAGASVVALDSERTSLMLHGEVVPDGTTTVSHEGLRHRKTVLGDNIAEEVVERAL